MKILFKNSIRMAMNLVTSGGTVIGAKDIAGLITTGIVMSVTLLTHPAPSFADCVGEKCDIEVGPTEKTMKGRSVQIDPRSWSPIESVVAIGGLMNRMIDLRKLSFSAQTPTDINGQASVYQIEIEASILKHYWKSPYWKELQDDKKLAREIDLVGISGTWLPVTIVVGYGDALQDATREIEIQKVSGNFFVFNFNNLPNVKSSLYMPGYKYEKNVQLDSFTRQIEILRGKIHAGVDIVFGRGESNGNLRAFSEVTGSWGWNQLYSVDSSNGKFTPVNTGEGSMAVGIQFLKTVSLLAGIGGTARSTVAIRGNFQEMSNTYKYLQAVISPFNFRNENEAWKGFLNRLNLVIDWKFENRYELKDYSQHERITEIDAPVATIKLQYNQ